MEKPAANTHKCAETQEPGAFAILLEVMPVNKAQSIPLWDEPGLIHHSSGLDAACAAPALWWLPATSEILSHLLLANTDNNKFFTLCHDRGVKFQLFKINGPSYPISCCTTVSGLYSFLRMPVVFLWNSSMDLELSIQFALKPIHILIIRSTLPHLTF